MSEKSLQFTILAVVFVFQYLFEHLYPQEKRYNQFRSGFRNFLIGAANMLILLIPSSFIVALLHYTESNRLGLFHLLQLPFVFNLLLTIVLMDLALYWWHRLNHTRKLFWRFHKFHHLDVNLNTTTSLRFHTIELLFSSVFKCLFFFLMGFSFMPIIVYETLFFTAIVFHHSNIRMGTSFDLVYRNIFSSPLMHRIHHSNRKAETNSNYGSVFSFWDRLFGTYLGEAKEAIVFGVDEEL